MSLWLTHYQDKTIRGVREHPLSGEQHGAVKDVGAQRGWVPRQKIPFQPRLIFDVDVEIHAANSRQNKFID